MTHLHLDNILSQIDTEDIPENQVVVLKEDVDLAREFIKSKYSSYLKFVNKTRREAARAVPLPYWLLMNSCRITNDTGCESSMPIQVLYKDKFYIVSDRHFGDDRLCWLRDHNGVPVKISQCYISKKDIAKIKKHQVEMLVDVLGVGLEPSTPK